MTEREGGPSRWRLAVVSSVSHELPDSFPTIVLRESVPPYREVRIQVGLQEGIAVAYAWRGVDTPRPLTHDLVTELFALHNISVEAVRITGRKGKVFFAEMDTTGPRGPQLVSCRPSDAIALALRHRLPTPILVADEVLDGREIDQD